MNDHDPDGRVPLKWCPPAVGTALIRYRATSALAYCTHLYDIHGDMTIVTDRDPRTLSSGERVLWAILLDLANGIRRPVDDYDTHRLDVENMRATATVFTEAGAAWSNTWASS